MRDQCIFDYHLEDHKELEDNYRKNLEEIINFIRTATGAKVVYPVVANKLLGMDPPFEFKP